MSNIDPGLQKKIDALGLSPIDDEVYNKHLKHMENIGVGVRHFKYYKLYRQSFMPYSQEYLLGNSIEHILKREKEYYKRLYPSIFMQLKDKYISWKFKRRVKKLRKNYQKNNPPHLKNN
ncbi:hypothetical protein [Bacillus thuringiensis]|uniref:hypothetical protein n=1 Tax=Bacillus thuringiensis TaxID=1428 RepID=UPI0015D491A5|nr:hypothetical protein [Bacillus thuringiensis]